MASPLNAASIFEPLRFRNLTVKNRIFRSNMLGPLRQLRRLRQPGPHQLGSEVRARRRRRDHLVVRAGARCAAASSRTTRPSTATTGSRSGARSARRVHEHDCKYILQLSHGGRAARHPRHRATDTALSSTDKTDPLHGFHCERHDDRRDPARPSRRSPQGARRAREAGSTASSCTARTAISSRSSSARRSTTATDEYGGSLENRARFVLDIVAAIRARGRRRLPPADEDQRDEYNDASFSRG